MLHLGCCSSPKSASVTNIKKVVFSPKNLIIAALQGPKYASEHYSKQQREKNKELENVTWGCDTCVGTRP